jgi:hypothetical protein
VARCFFTRLESSSERSSDFRRLKFPGEEWSQKLVGNEGSSIIALIISEIRCRRADIC